MNDVAPQIEKLITLIARILVDRPEDVPVWSAESKHTSYIA